MALLSRRASFPCTPHMPQLSEDPDAREGEQRVLSNVQEHGVHIVHVPEDEKGPGFSYTVGLFPGHAQSEIIVFGLPRDVSHTLLNEASALVREGSRFEAGAESADLLHGYLCVFRQVPERHHSVFLGWAQWLNGYRPLSAVQLFYPDRNGRWPWDPDVTQQFASQQPILEREPVPDWA